MRRENDIESLSQNRFSSHSKVNMNDTLYGSLSSKTIEDIAFVIPERNSRDENEIDNVPVWTPQRQSSVQSTSAFIFIFLAIIFSVAFLSYDVNTKSPAFSYVQQLLHVGEGPDSSTEPSVVTITSDADLTDPNGLVLQPTMYPTEAHPTMYPSQVTPTVLPTKVGIPTLYPTAKAPTQYPTDFTELSISSASASPTLSISQSASPSSNSVTDAPSLVSDASSSPVVSTESTAPSSTSDTVVASSSNLNFTTHRDGYDYLDFFGLIRKHDFLNYKVLENYVGVVEPGVDMYVYIFDVEESEEEDNYYYKYTICEAIEGGSCDEFYYSEPFSYSCSPLVSNYTVSVQQYETSSNAMTSATAEGSLLCLYVRREFRTLTPADLNKTMNAMWTMWELDEEDGIELYGDKFHNYARLLEYHYFNAAWQDSDHIHEGNGFIAQHIKMDLIFQRSMQAVDPTVTLPYWDFTIENSTGTQAWDSPIFTPDTFGSLPIPVDTIRGWTYKDDSIETGGISDGRWKNFKAEYNTKYDDLYSAYGYMRAPWNMNPSNLITRFTSVDKWLPTCDNHYTLMSYTLLSDFLKQVPYGAHASVHGVVGGVYGCDLFDPLLDAGYIIDEQAKLNLCKNWIFYLKEFYRDNLILPKSDCTSVDENGEFSTAYEHQNCGFECVTDFVNILYLQLQRSVLNSDYECIDVDNMPQEGWLAWKEFICDGDGYKVFGGDHLESASPADPSFWPIHPTLERLLHARFMAGGFDTDEWPSDAVNDYVCNKKTCYDSEQAATDDIRAPFSTWDTCCYGHFQDDQMLDAPNGDRYSGVGPTNREIFEWTNPTLESYAMEYIYDGFTWEHCQDTGYDFDALMEYLKYNISASAFNESAITITTDKGWRH